MRATVFLCLCLLVSLTLTLNQSISHRDAINISTIQPLPIRSTIGYQIHSWDDLREWTQALKKGARWFKLDFNWPFNSTSLLDRDVCMVQENLSAEEKDDTRGCILLTHNDPIVSRTNYNTSNNVLELISDPEYRHWFAGRERIYIAVCFKLLDNTDICGNSQFISSWLSLLDDFFARARKVIDEQSLNVEFIVDGAGTAGGDRGCLADRWSPLVSTWISHRDPMEALHSNEKDKGYNSFQIMNLKVDDNDPEKYLKPMAEVDYGKFSQQNTYPYLMWEPDRQNVGELYERKGLAQAAGFKFAINFDIAHFQVFSANLSGGAWNVPVPSENSGKILAYTGPEGDVRIITSSTTNQTTHLILHRSDHLYAKLDEISRHVIPMGRIVSMVTIEEETKRKIFLSDDRGRLSEYHLRGDKVKLEKSWRSGGNLGVQAITVQDITVYYEMSKDGNTTECGILLERIHPGRKSNDSVCVSVEAFDHVSFSLSLPDANDSSCPSNHIIISIISSHHGRLSLSFECVDPLIPLHSFSSSSPIGIGSQPEVSTLRYNGQNHLMIVVTDGHCSNDLRKNTDANVAVCDVMPTSELHVLNYYYGTMESWLRHVRGNGGLINSCHKAIMFGSYDMGSDPAVSLFQVGEEVAVVTSHTGWNYDEEEEKKNHCGLPKRREGGVIDSWPLPTIS
ncbi:hypothetical protein PROFUN_07790 [Planoprotostelium fungivorum]|uniref:Uncharacterized protein n=1 Tax=Planoprotostelium fungivorum TaxID=1890364 RepID=A0A2P6MX41_9EUKA|nr:hypothetical protein PROFUN_07790 [Planoprotostelium fungivorum]